MKGRELYSKLFVSDRFFTIAIRKRAPLDPVGNTQFSAQYVMPANRQNWAADPMLADANGKTYLFYEAVSGDKGHIEVAEIMDDCTLGTSVCVLQDDCHYSYPFVFCYKGLWYMIPESSAASEVRLYCAERFPERWKIRRVLLREKAVDTTVFEYNGQLYLLTFFLVPGSERVVPHAYQLDLSEKGAELKEIPWAAYDQLRVRGAGPVFERGHILYRPAQISQEQRYGDGLAFYRTDVRDAYRETFVSEMSAAGVSIPGYYVDGLHTYSGSERFEAIDIRCCVQDYLKPAKKVLSRLKR